MSETEPDARDVLANERTYLAWIRTSLALIAGGVAIVRLLPTFDVTGANDVLGITLVLTGAITALSSPRRWRRADAAIRAGEPLPGPKAGEAISIVIAIVGVLTIAFLVWGTKR
jgi:putative membrane protein